MREEIKPGRPKAGGQPKAAYSNGPVDAGLEEVIGALGSLREALKASGVPGLEPFTRDKGRPTPVLVRGVERRCAVDTDPSGSAADNARSIPRIGTPDHLLAG